MSRCFPFPPPGYKRNGICDEALIESIKLQREEEKTKKERKKKEKKREKKHKENAGENGEIKHKNQSHKRRHKDERSQKDKKVGDDKKRRANEIEHFEKSGLTEELGHPVGSQNSSDSSLNSNKRQKHNSPPDGQHNPGSIIRIRLPTQRQKDPEILPSKEEPCSASGRADDAPAAPRPGKEFGGEHPCSTSGGQELTLRLSKEKPCSSSQASENFACKAETAPPSNLREIGLTPSMLLCSDLIENWVPPPVQSECTDFGDQEWLFERKQNHKPENKIFKDLSNGLSHGNSTPWPRACYLPEADIYALPFTVPF